MAELVQLDKDTWVNPAYIVWAEQRGENTTVVCLLRGFDGHEGPRLLRLDMTIGDLLRRLRGP